MTYNEKKRFLEGYIYSVRRIKGLHRELEEWQTIGTNITQKFKPVMVQNGMNSSKIEECAIRIANIEDQIISEINKAEDNKHSIETAINHIKDTRRRELLRLRYLNNVPVRTIAIDYDKPEDNIYKMIRTAIKTMPI